MRVGVVGAGGVGGYFGARLAQAGNEVCVVARGEHLAAIRERGLQVRSPKGDALVAVAASDTPAHLGPCDVIFVCVKSYDTAAVVGELAPMLSDRTAVVSLQNGVDNEEQIAEALGSARVLGGAAFIFSSITEPGVVEHTGGPARLVFGELNSERSARAEELLTTLLAAGVDAEVAADIHVVLWTKFAFICAAAGMTAVSRLPLRDIYDCSESRDMFARIVDEVVVLAHEEGVPLGVDVREQVLQLAASVDRSSYSSLYHDLVSGHRMELEALHGAVVRRATHVDQAVPTCEAIYAILRPWALRTSQARS
jgi:2-dehydropantoate 2-reductase